MTIDAYFDIYGIFLYSQIHFGQEERFVCCSAFHSLHGVTRSRVARIAEHAACNITSPKDGRGHHDNRPKKKSDDILRQVDSHIRGFPLRSSHYSREKTKKKYLPASLSVRGMHMLYLQKHEPDIYLLLSQNKEASPHITYNYYYQYFVDHFNYSFGCPRSDTCEFCDSMKVKIDQEKCEVIKARLENEKKGTFI